MKALKRYYFLFFVLLFTFNFLKASDGFIVYNGKQQTIGNKIFHIVDSTNQKDIQAISSSKKFEKLNQEIPNLGVSNYNNWLKIPILNKSRNKEIYIEISNPLIDDIEFYIPISGGSFDSILTGESRSYENRQFDHQNFIFRLQIPIDSTVIFYLKVKSGNQVLLPISLKNQETLEEGIIQQDKIYIFYLSIMLSMILYNFFIYITTRDKSYLFYVLYIITICLSQFVYGGYTTKYLWPDWNWGSVNSLYIITDLSGIAALAFVKSFLRTKELIPRFHKVINLFMLVYLVGIILAVLNFHNLSYQILDINGFFLSIMLFGIGFYLSFKGHRHAVFFLIAWSSFFVSVIIYVLKNKNIIPDNDFNYVLLVGSGIETFLLSFALADRINLLKKEREQSQTLALSLAKENESIIKEQNILLERKVDERTIELQKTNESLKSAQAQLINAEKMASLGQLTAGIAHEINNPINYIINSIPPLKRDMEDILDLVSKTEELEKNEDKKLIIQKIYQLRKDIDVDFSVKEITLLLEGIEEGARRTENIVKGLKNFSHLNETSIKPTNLNEGIKSTLSLLKYKLKTQIKITLQLNAISLVECNGGNINQVFMNIISNAIDAVEKKFGTTAGGEILVETCEKEDSIVITMKDNGIGMDEDVKLKIFDPFFTTKDIGKGTGLGMSIVYGIIEAHKGKISIESMVETGTTITIQLPVRKG